MGMTQLTETASNDQLDASRKAWFLQKFIRKAQQSFSAIEKVFNSYYYVQFVCQNENNFSQNVEKNHFLSISDASGVTRRKITENSL